MHARTRPVNCPTELSASELYDLGCVVDSARAMGILRLRDEVIAVREADGVVIRLHRDGQLHECVYEHRERWMFHFLRDLVQGAHAPRSAAG